MKKMEVDMPAAGICSFGKVPIISERQIKDYDAVICGIPYDWGVGFRPGTRFGPRSIREMSSRFSLDGTGYWDIRKKRRMLSDIRIGDIGDVDILYYQREHNFQRIRNTIQRIREGGALPVVLGGDHSITYPVLRSCSGEERIGVLHLDAHLDFKDHHHGLKHTNSSAMKRASQLTCVTQITSIGLRGIRVSELDYTDAVHHGVSIIPSHALKQNNSLTLIENNLPEKTYISIDIDVLDPSIAPGTGSPEPEGLSLSQLKKILEYTAQETEVIGFDLVEVNPLLDSANVTSLIASTLIIEMLGFIFENR